MGGPQRWWAVRVLFETSVGGVPDEMVHDVIFLALARGEAEAQTKGAAFAAAASHEYPNPFGEMVRVQFDQVIDVHEIGEVDLGDGTELYMSLEAGSDSEGLRERGRMKPKPRT